MIETQLANVKQLRTLTKRSNRATQLPPLPPQPRTVPLLLLLTPTPATRTVTKPSRSLPQSPPRTRTVVPSQVVTASRLKSSARSSSRRKKSIKKSSRSSTRTETSNLSMQLFSSDSFVRRSWICTGSVHKTNGRFSYFFYLFIQ